MVLLATRQHLWGGGEELLLTVGEALEDGAHTVRLAAPPQSAISLRSSDSWLAKSHRHFDVVIANDFRSLWVQSVRHPRAKKVFIVHGWWQTSKIRNLVARLIRARIVAVSGAVREAVIGNRFADGRSVHVLPFGPDHRRFRPPTAEERSAARACFALDEDELVCVFVGRLQPVKRPHVFLAACEAVGARPLIVAPRMATNAEEEIGLRAINKAVDAGAAVRADTDDVVRALWAADVFVSTSEFESLGVALMEAMAAGLPVVTTAVGGPRDFIDHGVSGLLTTTEDLASELRGLLFDSHRRKRMGRAAQDSVSGRRQSAVVEALGL